MLIRDPNAAPACPALAPTGDWGGTVGARFDAAVAARLVGTARHVHAAVSFFFLQFCSRADLTPDVVAPAEWLAVGGELSREAVASEPGEAAGLLRGGSGAAARVRVHAQGQPGESSLQK